MHIAIVNVHVKPEFVEEFKNASLENARNSFLEDGVVRFDALQNADDSTRFVLYEVYRTPEDQLKHRETKHYLKWRETVENMMAEPRLAQKYKNLLPADADWKK